VVQLVSLNNGKSAVIAERLGDHQAGGLGIGATKNNQGQRLAVVALTFNDEAAVIDLETRQIVTTVRTGIAPFSAVVGHDSSVAYVSDWGGRFPNQGERTAATGPEDHADQVLVDEHGLVNSGTVARVDLLSGKVTSTIEVGLHPSGMAWDEALQRLYVANSNSDTISVIDTKTNHLIETITLQPFNKKVAGISPESVALAPDHSALYIACAGINAVGVVSLKNPHPHVAGFIPTGWYPRMLWSALMASSLRCLLCLG
jgi:YVTN family beta-propeller protein